MPSGSMPCRSCGQPVREDDERCSNCGFPVHGEPPSPAADMDIQGSDPEGDGAASDTRGGDGEREPGLLEAPVESAAGAAEGLTAGGIVPGAYLPPSTVHRPAPTPSLPVVREPIAAPPPQAGAWHADMPEASPVEAAPLVAAPPPAPPAPRSQLTPGRASLFADLPFGQPGTIATWLVAGGSVVGSLAFLLPWAPRVVDYLSSWGLSSASRLPILLILVVTAVLAILPNRIASWVRNGVLGLLGGGLYLGLLWPFVLGDFGSEWGSVIAAAAALMLIVGGVLGVAPHQDVTDGPG